MSGVSGAPIRTLDRFTSARHLAKLWFPLISTFFDPVFSSPSSGRARGSIGLESDDDDEGDEENTQWSAIGQWFSKSHYFFMSASLPDGLRDIRSCALLTRSLSAT